MTLHATDAVPLDDSLPSCMLGECPVWDNRKQILYWVDIKGHAIHSYDIAEKTCTQMILHAPVGFIVQDENGSFVAGLDDGLYTIDYGTQHVTPFVSLHTDIPYQRFNDGACDRQGRLYAGTMKHDDPEKTSNGALYRLDGSSLTLVQPAIPVSNGLAWSPSGNLFYHADTDRQIIWQYDYDPQKGLALSRRIFKTFADQSPDGLTIDDAGRLYVCLYNGGRIERYRPDGTCDLIIPLPVKHVTNCTFGGPDMNRLFITTAKGDDVLSGQVFQTLVPDATGLVETRFTPGAADAV